MTVTAHHEKNLLDIQGKILLCSMMPFPTIAWWAKALKARKICFDAFEHYQKMSGRNRYYLAGPSGKQLLSIPLKGGRNQRVAMNKVRVDNDSGWRKTHWRTIQSFYGRAPFFEFFAEDLGDLFESSSESENLYDWSLQGIRLVAGMMGMKLDIEHTEIYREEYPCGEFSDIRILGGENKDVQDQRPYHQVFQDRAGFVAGCSVLDLMFCLGPQALNYLKR
ncbi:MAG TPA: WbqC family protein [Edaphocola sp.]|nr:WbqC family protein [Edaphocola sp.]